MTELIKDRVRVEWDELGEGICGDYNPNDPDDIELLRFDVSYLDDEGNWIDPGDASYCTRFPASTPENVRLAALEYLMREVYDPLMNGYSIKKLCEHLSWIEPKWIK
jgi:hypothetical protein